jgi:hypothetical protein
MQHFILQYIFLYGREMEELIGHKVYYFQGDTHCKAGRHIIFINEQPMHQDRTVIYPTDNQLYEYQVTIN